MRTSFRLTNCTLVKGALPTHGWICLGGISLVYSPSQQAEQYKNFHVGFASMHEIPGVHVQIQI